jgi:hypothetical protein
MVATLALLVLGMGHRSGRIKLLGWGSNLASEVSGLPPWVALPAGLATVSLLCAVFGMYWDISLHIDNGRDPGPLANPAHYFILVGLFGIFAAGWLAIVLPTSRPGPAAIRITRDWHVPVSSLLLMSCASFALLGFPLDDVSHRLFGQDVTLWGPTHLMLIGGAGLSLIGILGLLAEGRLATAEAPTESPVRGPLARPAVARAFRVAKVTGEHILKLRLIFATGGFLVGLSVFQGEFDFGVPQFRLLYEPVLIAVAAGIGLTSARIIGGRGTAIGAAFFFIAVRGILAILVGPVLGETTPHLPLYLGEALLVEAAAFAVRPDDHPYRFGMVSGALIGSLGVVAEYAWSHAWMPVAWPAHILPSAIALSVPCAIAGGVIGVFIGSALQLRGDLVARRAAWGGALASLLVIGGAVAFLAHTTVPAAKARVELSQTTGASKREAQATVRITPASAAKDADWLNETSWQGGDKLVLHDLRRVGDGVYRTVDPLPLYGDWKSTIRLHKGRDLAAVPVFMPADRAIPVKETSAPPRFTRSFIADRKILQRERKKDVPGWLWGTAYLIIFAIFLVLIGMLGWGLVRLAGGGPGAPVAGARPVRRSADHAIPGVA